MNGRAKFVAVGKAAGHAPTLDPANPMLSARTFVAQRALGLRHDGAFYCYDGAAYRSLEERSVRADIYHFLDGANRLTEVGELVPFDPTRSKVDNVVDALRAISDLPHTKQAPCWLADDPGFDPFDIVSCQNGLLHIPSGALLPATPAFYTHQAVPFAYDPDAPPPTYWLRVQSDTWPDDVESQRLWQEWCGYMLTPSTRFQKILLDIGPPRCGKGMKYRVIRQVVGSGSYCSTSLNDLAADFGLQPLIGKSVAVISDARMSGLQPTPPPSPKTCCASAARDGPSVRRKHLANWSGSAVRAICGHLERTPCCGIEDASGALASRFLVLRTTESWLGREDLELEAKFVPELPGILNWALEGYAWLYDRGRFVQPRSAAELVQQFEALGSPIRAFLGQRCEVGPPHEVSKTELFDAWCQWCDANGRALDRDGRRVRARPPSGAAGTRGAPPRHEEQPRVECTRGSGSVPRSAVATLPGGVR